MHSENVLDDEDRWRVKCNVVIYFCTLHIHVKVIMHFSDFLMRAKNTYRRWSRKKSLLSMSQLLRRKKSPTTSLAKTHLRAQCPLCRVGAFFARFRKCSFCAAAWIDRRSDQVQIANLLSSCPKQNTRNSKNVEGLARSVARSSCSYDRERGRNVFPA